MNIFKKPEFEEKNPLPNHINIPTYNKKIPYRWDYDEMELSLRKNPRESNISIISIVGKKQVNLNFNKKCQEEFQEFTSKKYIQIHYSRKNNGFLFTFSDEINRGCSYKISNSSNLIKNISFTQVVKYFCLDLEKIRGQYTPEKIKLNKEGKEIEGLVIYLDKKL
jgi:hypothetical protein